jgi:hypothetical protein
VVLELVSCDGAAFSKQDWKSIDKVREKYKHNRRIETDFHFFLIKEIVSQVHSRASQFVQMKLASAVIGQLLLPDPQVEDEECIERSGEGRNKTIL